MSVEVQVLLAPELFEQEIDEDTLRHGDVSAVRIADVVAVACDASRFNAVFGKQYFQSPFSR